MSHLNNYVNYDESSSVSAASLVSLLMENNVITMILTTSMVVFFLFLIWRRSSSSSKKVDLERSPKAGIGLNKSFMKLVSWYENEWVHTPFLPLSPPSIFDGLTSFMELLEEGVR
ncbi:hypothetical protein LIER_13270 [Lithospermum erythrorhizon]|uniref:ATP synthase F0 subunit 8 n=1 Tax=Lithospermum erythrorhizon TaxID=34254 RepID=A0AAV3PYZ6_LITER